MSGDESSHLGELCMKCHIEPITYRTNNCGHGLFCSKCAMKCATGGKCKVCGTLYSGLERVR